MLAALSLACEPGQVTYLAPGGPAGGPRLGTLVVSVRVDSADAAVADSLGWAAGVPGAEVRILRNGTAEWLAAETDGQGNTIFSELEPDLYYTYAERVLSGEEAARASAVVQGFGDGAFVAVGTDTVRVARRLVASRRGGLVISEVSGAEPPPWEVPGQGLTTQANRYFEVYNQSDATLHLDGNVFGAFSLFGCQGCGLSCVQTEKPRTDPGGVYAHWMLAFPGSGTEYPIAPGEAKLVAVSALDHREIHPDMFDLRGADFEIGVPGFADNPSVPDMLDVGRASFFTNLLLNTNRVYFLAAPFDPGSLPVEWRHPSGRGFVRVPLSLMHDVAASVSIWPDDDAQNPPCVPVVHPDVDRFPGGFKEIGFEAPDNRLRSFQREVLRTEGGIPVLMDTRTSAADFSIMRVTPGTLPGR